MQSAHRFWGSRQGVFLLLFLFCFLYIGLFALLRIPFHEPDDVMLSYIANGSLGGQRWHLLHTNVVFGWILQFFYSLFSAFNWYGLAIIGTMAVSFAVWLLLAIRLQTGLPGICIVLCCAVISLSYATFTVAAYLSIFAGIGIILAHFLHAIEGRFLCPAGIFLIALGYSIRSITLPSAAFVFAGPLLLFLIGASGSWKDWKKWIVHCVASGFLVLGILLVCTRDNPLSSWLVFLLCIAMRFILKRQASPVFLRFYNVFLLLFFLCAVFLSARAVCEFYAGWADYRACFAMRAKVVDGPHVAYDQIADALQSIGISETDYSMVLSWFFADTGVFSSETLQTIAVIIKDAYTPFVDLCSIVKSLLSYPSVLFLLFPLLSGFLAGSLRKKNTVAFVLVSLLAFWALVFILLARERLVERVFVPLAIGSALQMLLLYQGDSGKSIPVQRLLQGASVAVLFVLLAFRGTYLVQNKASGAQTEIEQYTTSHPDDFYVMDSGLYNASYFSDTPVFSIKPTDALRNVIKTGSSDTLSPRQYEQMNLFGIRDPDRLLLAPATQDNVYYVGYSADLYLAYLREQVSSDVTCQVVTTFSNGSSVYAFSVSSGE